MRPVPSQDITVGTTLARLSMTYIGKTHKGPVVRACYDGWNGELPITKFVSLGPYVGANLHTVTKILRNPTRVRTTLTRNLKSWIVVKP